MADLIWLRIPSTKDDPAGFLSRIIDSIDSLGVVMIATNIRLQVSSLVMQVCMAMAIWG